ncbi:MAG TPA: hypothetical protein VLQ93_13445 [Myxococcaceae bacterium]|nr:hypothetical protein [Myxococcaceae bacterium]
MEWLEFGRWSPEVEQRLAQQAARLSAVARSLLTPPRPESASARAHRLAELLKRAASTNPWGHPPAEC